MSRTFLTYHELGHEKSDYAYYLKAATFEEHLQLTVDLKGRGKSDFSVPSFTFDDGHVSQFSYAFPLLERYAQRAIFFVTTDWMGNHSRSMNWLQLRELSKSGHEIQSHTHSHPMLTHCSDFALHNELSRSKFLIEDKLGTLVDAISIPNGRWNNRVLMACAAAGYRRCFTSDSWIQERRQLGLLVFGRMNVAGSLTGAKLGRLLKRGSSAKRFHDLQSHCKYAVRRALGDQLYHRAWRILARSGSRDEFPGI